LTKLGKDTAALRDQGWRVMVKRIEGVEWIVARSPSGSRVEVAKAYFDDHDKTAQLQVVWLELFRSNGLIWPPPKRRGKRRRSR
jgi:hypothetical protein